MHARSCTARRLESHCPGGRVGAEPGPESPRPPWPRDDPPRASGPPPDRRQVCAPSRHVGPPLFKGPAPRARSCRPPRPGLPCPLEPPEPREPPNASRPGGCRGGMGAAGLFWVCLALVTPGVLGEPGWGEGAEVGTRPGQGWRRCHDARHSPEGDGVGTGGCSPVPARLGGPPRGLVLPRASLG